MITEQDYIEVEGVFIPDQAELPAKVVVYQDDDAWFLSPEDEKMVLATARYNKIKKFEWLEKQGKWVPDDNFDSIALTEEEETLALISANKIAAAKALFSTMRAESRNRLRLEAEEKVAKWNYAHFYRTMRDEAYKQWQELIFNDTTAPLIKTLCFKLSHDDRYETEMGFSFKKMLVIRGPVGLGKSWLISLVAQNPVCAVQIITMGEIVKSVKATGDFTGLKFGTHSLIYIDDVGTEYDKTDKIGHYGTTVNWFASWFEEMYAKNKMDLRKVIISTNDNFDILEQKYGFRVRDRMAEVCDVLEVEGESMRRLLNTTNAKSEAKSNPSKY